MTAHLHHGRSTGRCMAGGLAAKRRKNVGAKGPEDFRHLAAAARWGGSGALRTSRCPHALCAGNLLPASPRLRSPQSRTEFRAPQAMPAHFIFDHHFPPQTTTP